MVTSPKITPDMSVAATGGVSPIAISVIVPTCGRVQLLQRSLHALRRQTFDANQFEIIVVDDAPAATTRQAVIEIAALAQTEGLAIHYIACRGPHGPAAARNCGWRAAAGAVIAFTDDDTVAHPDWLRNGFQALNLRGDAAWGKIIMPLPPQPTDYELDASRLTQAGFVTANCFCTRSLLQALDGFDERFRTAWREDSDLFFRILKLNAAVMYVPNAIVEHPVRPAPWGVSLQQQKKILFDALLFKKHPFLYRKLIRSAPRWDYYLIVLMLALASGAWWQDWMLLAAVAGATWLALTTALCLRRLNKTSLRPSHFAEMLLTSILIPPLAVFWRAVGALRFRVGFL